MKNPRAIVAYILSGCVVVFFVGGVIKAFVVRDNPTQLDLEGGVLWADIVKVLIGGLIGYMAGSESPEDKSK